MAAIPPLPDDALRRLCLTIGDTDTGLTGSEIGFVLQQLGLDDPDPKRTKWRRLFDILKNREIATGSGEILIQFVQMVCRLSCRSILTIAGAVPQHQYWRSEINKALESTPYAVDSKGNVRKLRMTVQVPTINDRQSDFDTLFRLWAEVNDDELEVTFDFSRCGFLRQNAVAFLGGLARLIAHRCGTFRFDWQSLDPAVAGNLAKNCFRDMFGDPSPIGTGHAIPYREDKEADKTALMAYLKQLWLGQGWVNISPALRDAIVGRVWEIYANAFEHGRSAIGVFSCGQHYPKRKELDLAVVDFGVGIPSNVRQFVGDKNSQPTKR